MMVFGWCALISAAAWRWFGHDELGQAIGTLLLGGIALSIVTTSWEAYEKWKNDKEREERDHRHDDQLFRESDILEQSNPKLFDRLSRLQEEIPSRKCHTGFYPALFGGIAIGALPSFLTEHDLAWSIAIPLGYWICLIAGSLWMISLMFSSMNETPKDLRKRAVEILAQRDALKNEFSEHDLDVIRRICEIAWETKRRGNEVGQKITYLLNLEEAARRRFYREQKCTPVVTKFEELAEDEDGDDDEDGECEDVASYKQRREEMLSRENRLKKIKERMELLNSEGVNIEERIRKQWVGTAMVDARNLFLELPTEGRVHFKDLLGTPSDAIELPWAAQVLWLEKAAAFFEESF